MRRYKPCTSSLSIHSSVYVDPPLICDLFNVVAHTHFHHSLSYCIRGSHFYLLCLHTNRGCVDVVATVVSFVKMQMGTGMTIERRECSLPPLQYATRAFWLDVGVTAKTSVEGAGLDFEVRTRVRLSFTSTVFLRGISSISLRPRLCFIRLSLLEFSDINIVRSNRDEPVNVPVSSDIWYKNRVGFTRWAMPSSP